MDAFALFLVIICVPALNRLRIIFYYIDQFKVASQIHRNYRRSDSQVPLGSSVYITWNVNKNKNIKITNTLSGQA